MLAEYGHAINFRKQLYSISGLSRFSPLFPAHSEDIMGRRCISYCWGGSKTIGLLCVTRWPKSMIRLLALLACIVWPLHVLCTGIKGINLHARASLQCHTHTHTHTHTVTEQFLVLRVKTRQPQGIVYDSTNRIVMTAMSQHVLAVVLNRVICDKSRL